MGGGESASYRVL